MSHLFSPTLSIKTGMDMAIQNIHKSFSFKHFEKYEALRDYDLSVEDPLHHEIISGAQCLYFDFDGEVDLEKLKNSIISFFQEYKIPLLINVYSSSDNVKQSYHVVVKGAYFKNHIDCGNAAKIIGEGIPSFDSAVYSRRRNLRMLRSRKVDSTRVKRFMTTLYKSENYKCRYENDPLYMSLVCGIADCQLLDLSPASPTPSLLSQAAYSGNNSNSNSNSNELLSKEVQEYMLQLVSNIMPHVFSVRNVEGNSIFLIRQRPAECPICNRVHKKENAVVSLRNNGRGMERETPAVYFTCFRDTSNSLCIDENEEGIEVDVIPDKNTSTSITTITTMPIKSELELFVAKLIRKYPLGTPRF
jgi:hypothetical protein